MQIGETALCGDTVLTLNDLAVLGLRLEVRGPAVTARVDLSPENAEKLRRLLEDACARMAREAAVRERPRREAMA